MTQYVQVMLNLCLIVYMLLSFEPYLIKPVLLCKWERVDEGFVITESLVEVLSLFIVCVHARRPAFRCWLIFNCTPVGWASDSMMAPTKSYSF